jgi:hypothetical protein
VSAAKSAAGVEAKFLRGELGIDGQSDAASAEEKAEGEAKAALLRGNTWLGREFLTWLLFRSNGSEGLCLVEGHPLVVAATGGITLRGSSHEVSELKAKGNGAAYAKTIRRALNEGLAVHILALKLEWNGLCFEVTLDAEFLDSRAVRLPTQAGEDEGTLLADRLERQKQLGELIAALVATFRAIRVEKSWSVEVEAMQRWASGGKSLPSRRA